MNEKRIFSSVKVVVLTLIAVKLIGFVKQAVIAAYFGTSGSIDKFLLVSELMESLGVAVFSAIAITFLTIYVESLVNGGKEEASRVTSNTFTFFLPFVLILIVLIIVFSDQVASVVAPGYIGEDNELISKYIKLFSITMINMFVYYICNAVLEAEKVFFPGKIVGVIRSICVIMAVVFLSGKFGINAMFIGVLTYYILESCFLLIFVRKKVKFKISKPFSDKRVKNIFKLSAPLFVSYGVLQIQSIVDKAIASGLSEGSIATLSYSGYLYNTTHSILIGGLCTVIFSFFTTFVAEKKEKLLLDTLYKYIRISIIILILITTLFIGYSREIVSIVYERGAFGEDAANNVSLAFCAYSVGLVFMGVRDIMIRAHYAYQNNGMAMINGLVGVAVNVAMSITLSHFFGFVGIAFATSISSVFIAILSCQTIKKNIKDFRISNLTKFLFKIVLALLITAAAIYSLNRFFTVNLLLVDICIKGCISTLVYVLSLKLLKCEEINDIKQLVMGKFKKN